MDAFMTDISCTYGDGRDEAIVALLYGETDGSPDRAGFEAHVQTCARCRAELAGLRGVRTQLARWSPPEPINLQVGIGNSQSAWWRQIPAWAQVAAALLFLGVSAGMANLDIRYDHALIVTERRAARASAGNRHPLPEHRRVRVESPPRQETQ